METCRLTVNVDHVATVRNARGTAYPDPVHAAILAEHAGADGITVHLREDRRHIRERDVEILRATVRRLNLEIARSPEVVSFALQIQPDLATLVPERREELTTEGGLDVASDPESVQETVTMLQETGIAVSLFVDPEERQVEAAAATGARFIELHTGRYADATHEEIAARELAALRGAAARAGKLGLRVNAGHGLRLDNARAIVLLPEVEELAIGHAIVARALYVGMAAAVREMREALRG
ncbi:MAG: pyridoxine 5'-phosphate synthase [Planctomycetaceae bacterium]